MTAPRPRGPWLPLLVTGIAVNTLGVVLVRAGNARVVLMVLGLALMLAAIIGLLLERRRR
ncbi:MAG TPA: hypothetical protein VHQ45_17290 [Gemmatimonadaceae bacterium]|nr:hypothetical protein [Gemmatimonadaceae bacterium]